jgi:hypothetical protein
VDSTSLLAELEPLLGKRSRGPKREALLAALNGVLGDYLAASNNPLAITMRMRRGGCRAAGRARVARRGSRMRAASYSYCCRTVHERS